MRNLEDNARLQRKRSHVSGIGDANTYCACIPCIPYMYTICIAAYLQISTMDISDHLWTTTLYVILNVISLANTCKHLMQSHGNPVSFLVRSTSGT